MSDLLKFMIQMWNMNDIDWLGYESNERYSFHHLKKKSDGGKKIVSNGAVLHQSSHTYLHTIEYYDLDKYLYLNKILKDVNNQMQMTTKEQLQQIRYVLKEFQEEYEDKKSSRDKDIIKKEYRLENFTEIK